VNGERTLYAVWIKIDETLPWIELKRTFQTRNEAKKGAEDFLHSMQMKITRMPEKAKPLRAIPTIKTRH